MSEAALNEIMGDVGQECLCPSYSPENTVNARGAGSISVTAYWPRWMNADVFMKCTAAVYGDNVGLVLGSDHLTAKHTHTALKLEPWPIVVVTCD